MADPDEAHHEYGLQLTPWDKLPKAQAVILAVAHEAYRQAGASSILGCLVSEGCVVDVKATFGKADFPGRNTWRL
jgi:UDP-N-acetyl-D-galactosamine dehydrogenase